MKKILFVCTANICRSPIAVEIFNSLAKEQNLEASAESAGVAALVGEPAASNAYRVLEELGLDIGEHRARQVNLDMVWEADLVLAMTPQHRDTLREEFRDLSERVYTLPEYAAGDTSGGIADPYGRNLGTYRASAREILHYMGQVVYRLERERTDPKEERRVPAR